MSGAGAFPAPAVAGSPMGPGAQGGGADLLAMINKQHGGANLAAFGGGGHFAGWAAAWAPRTRRAAPPGFDLSDFPSLGGPQPGGAGPMGPGPGARAGMGNVGPFGNGMGMSDRGLRRRSRRLAMSGGLFGGMDGMGSADGYGVVSLQKHRDPEFTMRPEDFPALPGAPGMGVGKGPRRACGAGAAPAGPGRDRTPAQGAGGRATTRLGGAPKPGGEGSPRARRLAYARRARTPSIAVAASRGRSRVRRPPTPWRRRRVVRGCRCGEQGLLGVIRVDEVTTLDAGLSYLTTLGLNLNSPGPLYDGSGRRGRTREPRHELELLLPRVLRRAGVARGEYAASAGIQPETPATSILRRAGLRRRSASPRRATPRAGWGDGAQPRGSPERRRRSRSKRRTEASAGLFWMQAGQSWDVRGLTTSYLRYDQLERRPLVGGQTGAGRRGAGPWAPSE